MSHWMLLVTDEDMKALENDTNWQFVTLGDQVSFPSINPLALILVKPARNVTHQPNPQDSCGAVL